jgi:hypothetical protein
MGDCSPASPTSRNRSLAPDTDPPDHNWIPAYGGEQILRRS